MINKYTAIATGCGAAVVATTVAAIVLFTLNIAPIGAMVLGALALVAFIFMIVALHNRKALASQVTNQPPIPPIPIGQLLSPKGESLSCSSSHMSIGQEIFKGLR